MSELNDFLKLIAEGKKTDPQAVKAAEKTKVIKEHIKNDLGSLFSELAALKAQKQEIIEEYPDLAEPTLIEEEQPVEEIKEQQDPMAAAAKYLTGKSFQQPVPDKTAADFKAITDKIKYLEQWVGKISVAGPGGGEVNLRWLDDVKRDTIADGRWLKYSEADKKFVFDEINPYEVVYNTTLVTTPTYTVNDSDYYVGVNYAGPTTITLPSSPNSGRMLIIKDESGNASTNPITVTGTVDNDPGGFIIQLDNGAIQMIYRNGWRIV